MDLIKKHVIVIGAESVKISSTENTCTNQNGVLTFIKEKQRLYQKTFEQQTILIQTLKCKSRHAFWCSLCWRNILLLNLYCKVGSPENSFVNVACYGCISAPKASRGRHFHMQPFFSKKNFIRAAGKYKQPIVLLCDYSFSDMNT